MAAMRLGALLTTFGALLGVGACGEFRTGAEPPDASAAQPTAGDLDAAATQDGAQALDPRVATLVQIPTEVPRVAYHSVWALSKQRATIVGNETIVDWIDGKFQITKVAGMELYGVWSNGMATYAVGTVHDTNTGVVMLRSERTAGWIQLTTVPHGLRAIWGDGEFRVAAGHDGIVYYGLEPVPFEHGTVTEPFAGTPATLFAPIMHAVGGNSRHNVIATASSGWIGWDGDQWHNYEQTIDLTRTFRAVWGPRGQDIQSVLIGANFYGLWRFTGRDEVSPDGGMKPKAKLINEERDDPMRANQFINGIWGESINDFVAVGTNGRFMRYTGATSAIIATAAGARDLWAVSGTSWDDVWVAGDDGVILHGAVQNP